MDEKEKLVMAGVRHGKEFRCNLKVTRTSPKSTKLLELEQKAAEEAAK